MKYWEKWTGFEGEAMRQVVNAYNHSQNRIHVDLLTISGIENKTLFAISGGDPPDVAGLYGPNVAQYVDDHAIEPLDKYCAAAGINASQYIPAYWRIGTLRGHIWALPSTPASTALHYNIDMLKAAGISRPPRTIEELDADSAKITKFGPNGRVLIAGFIPQEPGWWNSEWGFIFGGRLWDGHDRITANDPGNIRALTWIQSFSRQYGTQALSVFRSGFGTFSSPQNAFLGGKVAMELQGVWMSNYIHMFSPKLHWGAVPFPYPADRPDLANSTFVDEDVLVIPRGAKHPRAAFDFIKYVESQKGMEMLCLLQRKHTPLIKVSEYFIKHSENPYIRLFASLPRGKNTFFPPQIGIWPEYSAALNNAVDEVTLLRETPKQALDDVQVRIQRSFNEYLERKRMRGEAL
ncbi:MAG: ABC transporter substrate-binding protein [Armatimonadetes bacterium]|nr:ABC transporter substrate-binding protein [Armatimonadota bacterium]MDE2206256.1 ABC transporter substrate-binding protein [Armatimonadota bacterium]